MPIRRGLVLEGGGAKGAYQFGVLQAFQQAGIKFAVVAGSSVGGLNAALWSSGKLNWGEDLWLNMKPEDVYPLAQPLRLFIKYSLYTGWLVLAPLVLVLIIMRMLLSLDVVISTFRGRWAAFAIVAGLISLTLIGSIYFAWTAGSPWSFVGWAVALSSISPAWALVRGSPERVAANGIVWLALLLLVYIAITTAGLYHPDTRIDFGEMLIFMGIVVPGSLVLALLYLCIRYVSVLHTAPLRTRLKELVGGWRLSSTVIVTVAQIQKVTKPLPLLGTFFADVSADDIIHPRALRPRYVSLNNIEPEEQIKVLIATCALPLGFVPNIEYEGISTVDGGAIDNCPVLPVILRSCDEVIVVHLNPKIPKSDTQELQRCRSLYEKMPRDVQNRYSAFPKRAPKIRRVIPTKSLRGFLTGTLNFRAKYTRSLVEAGRRDGEEHLKRWGLLGWKRDGDL